MLVICAEGNFVSFHWWLQNKKSRSKIALFSNESHLTFDFWKRKQLHFSEENCLTTQKRPNFERDIYILPKTRGNKNKHWTHLGAPQRDCRCSYFLPWFPRVQLHHIKRFLSATKTELNENQLRLWNTFDLSTIASTCAILEMRRQFSLSTKQLHRVFVINCIQFDLVFFSVPFFFFFFFFFFFVLSLAMAKHTSVIMYSRCCGGYLYT